MNQPFKDRIKRTFIYPIWMNISFRNWEKKGQTIPPPHQVKAKSIKDYARQYSIDILIETGTYTGNMVSSMNGIFSQIFSIELDDNLCQMAEERFAKYSHIHIIQGNSSEVLPKLLSSIDQPCLFWLDAHYSGGMTAKSDLDTPIISELKHIFSHPTKGHLILIDDAREFTGRNDYPSIEDLEKFISKEHPNWVFEIKHDIIRIHE